MMETPDPWKKLLGNEFRFTRNKSFFWGERNLYHSRRVAGVAMQSALHH